MLERFRNVSDEYDVDVLLLYPDNADLSSLNAFADLLLKSGKMLDGALFTGKVCTTVLFVSLIILVLFPELNHWIVDAVALINAVFLTISFGSYIQAYYGKNKIVEDLVK